MSRRVAQLADRIVALQRPLLLAFDVDGTLAPIVDDSGAARVPPRVVRQLRDLHALRGIQVAIVTGRDGRSLRSVLRADEFHRAVEHGRVFARAGDRLPRTRLTASQRQKLVALNRWAEQQEGAQPESKAAGLSIHVRRLGRRAPARAAEILREAAKQASALGLQVRRGRAVLDAELFEANKGDAVLRLARMTRARSIVFIGDDLTDRAGIEAAVSAGGLGLFVRSEERPRAPRGASGSLRGPEEVHTLIESLLSAL